MEIHCNFRFIPGAEQLYTCRIQNQEIPSDEDWKLVGQHEDRRTNSDVNQVQIYSCDMNHLPHQLSTLFPNLESIIINISSLSAIHKSELTEFKKLRKIYIRSTQISFVPGDLFEELPEMEKITICSDNTMTIEPNILDGLENLKHVYFEMKNWKSAQFEYDIAVPSTDKRIIKLKSQLFDKFLEQDKEKVKKYIKSSSFKVQKFKYLSEKLKEENKKLQEKINLESQLENVEGTMRKFEKEVEVLRKQLLKVHSLKDECDIKLDYSVDPSKQPKLLEQIQKVLVDLSDQKFQLFLSNLKAQRSYLTSSDQTDSKVLDSKNLFEKIKAFKDFEIKVGTQNFYVHKLLLSPQNPAVSEAHVTGLTANLIDLSAEIFDNILKFIYNDELPICEDQDTTYFLDLFVATSRLKIDKLKKFAASKLLERINSENALEILNLSNKYEHDGLRHKAFEEIKNKYPKIDFKDEWSVDGEKLEKMIRFINEMQMLEDKFTTSMI